MAAFSTLKAGRDIAAQRALNGERCKVAFSTLKAGRDIAAQYVLSASNAFGALSVPSKRVETLPLVENKNTQEFKVSFSTLKAGRDIAAPS